MEFQPPEMFSGSWWVIIVIGIIIYKLFKMLVKRITKAVLKANKTINNDNELKTKLIHDRAIWWKIFWQELF